MNFMRNLIIVMNRVLIVVPTYNCHKQVLELLKDMHLVPIPDDVCIWFIDNLSSDGTFEATTEFINSNRCRDIYSFRTMQNNNLGGTHKIGFGEAISGSYDYVAILHGDNQAKFSDLVSLINRSRNEGNVKSYLGTRFSRKSNLIGYSKKRIFGNLVLNVIYSTFKLKKLTDLGSGLNLYKVLDLTKIEYSHFGDALTFNYELLLEMIDSDIPFEFVPIEWREADQVSNAKNIRIFIQGLKILFENLTGRQSETSFKDKIYDIDRYTND